MDRFRIDKHEALVFSFHNFNTPFAVKGKDHYAISIWYVETDSGAAVIIHYEDRSIALLHDLDNVIPFKSDQQDRKMEVKRRFREERYPIYRYVDKSCLEMTDDALVNHVLDFEPVWGDILRFTYENFNKPLIFIDRVYILTGLALDDEDYYYTLTDDQGERRYVSAAFRLVELDNIDPKDYQVIQNRYSEYLVNYISFEMT
jgi:hypothetical protein